MFKLCVLKVSLNFRSIHKHNPVSPCVTAGTSTSSTSWSTSSSDLWGWLPAPRNPPSGTTMSAASSSTGVHVCALRQQIRFCPSMLLTESLKCWLRLQNKHMRTLRFEKMLCVILFSHCVFSETIMFLHEIFHQGLKARIANWPTLVLGKLLPNHTPKTQTHSVSICSTVIRLHRVHPGCVTPHTRHVHTHTHTHSRISLCNKHSHCPDTQWPPGPVDIPQNLLCQKEAPSTDKRHLGDRLLENTTEHFYWQIQKEKGQNVTGIWPTGVQGDTELIFD